MWTDERVKTLQALWKKGLSASQIARQLGGVTRNAVIGKVHRLGLSGRAGKRMQPKRIGAARATPSPPRPLRRPPPPGPDCAAPKARSETLQAPGRVACITGLGRAMCRWPIGDPQMDTFTFCGAPAQAGAPYCEGHCRLAYRPGPPEPMAQDPLVRGVLAGRAA